MKDVIKISEIFEGCQGEGRFVGCPTLFIRVSGCSRNCSYCDSKYHTTGNDYTIKELVARIRAYKGMIVCWTGGEPLLYKEVIWKITLRTPVRLQTHFETNGDLLTKDDLERGEIDYWAISPKDLAVAKRCRAFYKYYPSGVDIKVVTDLKAIGMDMLKFATILMPLTTYNDEKDREIREKVLNYCSDHYVRYSPRVHYEVYGKKRGV